jgi:hypothetical protein
MPDEITPHDSEFQCQATSKGFVIIKQMRPHRSDIIIHASEVNEFLKMVDATAIEAAKLLRESGGS